MRLQKILLGLIAALLCLPVPTMLLLRGQALLPDWLLWVANRSLIGVTVQLESPPLSRETWFSGKYQEGLTRWLNENFGGRELLIRVNNQLLWSGFGKSYMSQELIVRGRHDDLFTSDYIAFREGFTDPATDAYLDELASKAAALQRLLAADGTVFGIVLTPDKPSLYPEDLPARFHPRNPGAPQPPPYVDRLIAALTRAGVTYVDGRAITEKVAAEGHWRAFPLNGIHWTHLTAAYTAEALLRGLETASGRPFPHLAVSNIHPSDVAEDQEGDLARLANLLYIPRETYTHADYSCGDPSPGTFTFVGGSFANAMGVLFDATSAFARINHYFYFKVDVHRFPQNLIEHVDEANIPWAADFQTSQAVVLEINPQFVTGKHPLAFLNAALAALPALPPRPAAAPASPLSTVYDGRTWFGEESAGTEHWRWSLGPASIYLFNDGQTPRSVRISYTLSALGSRTVVLRGPGGAILDSRLAPAGQRSSDISFPLELAPGRTVLRFESDQPAQHPSAFDTRNLDFQLLNFQVTPVN